MASDDVTLESLARIITEQVGGLRDQTAAFRADVLEKFGVQGISYLRLEVECNTIKAAIGRLEHCVAALSGDPGQVVDHDAVRRELDDVKIQFAGLRDRIEHLESQLHPRP